MIRRAGRRRDRRFRGILLGAGVATLCLATALPGQAPAQDVEEPAPILAEPRAGRTVSPAPAGLPEVIFPFPGIQLLLGFHQFSVHSDELDQTLGPGGIFSTGATFGLDWVGEYVRFGYLRQVYRKDLPFSTRHRGRDASFLGYEADQLWGHAGIRPVRDLFLGLGLGVQRRRIEISVRDSGTGAEFEIEETVVSADAIAEYTLALPFLIQLRYVRDFPGAFVEVEGTTVFLAYIVPF